MVGACKVPAPRHQIMGLRQVLSPLYVSASVGAKTALEKAGSVFAVLMAVFAAC